MSTSLSSDDALKMLIDGNRRFVADLPLHPHHDPSWRSGLLGGQNPFVAVLSCSDSRVPPEILFDQGFGDLFVIRNAGNLLDDVVEGSIEYAVEHLHVPLVVVLGHSSCGAVTGAVQHADAPGKLGAVMRILQPAVIQARNLPGDVVLNTVEASVRLSVERLSDVVRSCAPDGSARVIGAIYALDSGEVRFLSD